jgi:predicted RNase H-like HicB family nuclease
MKTMSLKLSITIHKDGRWYVAYCPELGVTSQGKNIEEAQENLLEAIELYIEDIPKKDLARFTETPFMKTIEVIKK